jgi:small-conductance mechanosensitive channel
MHKKKFAIYLIAVVIAILPTSISAQTNTENAEGKQNQTYQTAPVIFEGKRLFNVIGISSYPAEERAGKILSRIKALADNHSLSTDSIKIIELEDRTNLTLNGQILMSIVEVDATHEGITREILAVLIKNKIKEAVDKYRIEREPKQLLINTVKAIVATVLLLLILFILVRLFRKFNLFIEAKLKARIEGLESKSSKLIQANQLWYALKGFISLIKVITILILFQIYLTYVLSLYPWTAPFAGKVVGFIVEPLSAFGLSVLAFLPDLGFLIIIILVTRYLLKIAKLFFSGISQGTISFLNFEKDWAIPTYRIIRVLIIIFSIVIAYPYIPGSDSDAFKGISVLLGLMISLGSSSVIGNMIAGYTLIYRRTFKVGDRVKIDEHIGTVVEMKMFVTRLRSLKNEEIVIPNSNIVGGTVINFSSLSKGKGLILHTTVGIGYETPWRQVEQMLLIAAEKTEGLLKNPPPFVLQKKLADFAVDYEINVYCDSPEMMMHYYTELHKNILDVFNEYNVQIMTPAYEGDPEQPKVVPKDQWFLEPAKKKKDESKQ